MFDPDAGMPRINRGMVYLGACVRLRIQINLAVIKIDSGRSSASPGQLPILFLTTPSWGLLLGSINMLH